MFSRSDLSRRTPWFVAVCVALSAAVHAQEAPVAPDAKSLAEAMKVGESTRIGVEASIRNAIQQGRAKQSELDCVKAANLDFTVDVYAKAIAAALSAEEIKQGVAFFSSPEGQGYLQYSRSLELKARGAPDSTPKADLSPAEYAATTGFLEKSAGKKLLEDRVLETPELRSNLARAMSGLIQKCRS